MANHELGADGVRAKAKELFDQRPTNPPPKSRCFPFDEQPQTIKDVFMAQAADALAAEPTERVLREWRTEPRKKRPKSQQMGARGSNTHKP